MFADSMGIQIDSSRLVDTKDGLLVKDAVICRAMVLDYQGKKVLKSPEALAESMPTKTPIAGQSQGIDSQAVRRGLRRPPRAKTTSGSSGRQRKITPTRQIV
jgi:hypothetical protein